MQTKANQEQMYFYHAENGQMVMDRADHCDHIEQHHSRVGKAKPVYIAGTQTPLTQEEAKRYADWKNLALNLAARPAIPPFELPPGWAEKRARNAKLHEERKLKQKDGNHGN